MKDEDKVTEKECYGLNSFFQYEKTQGGSSEWARCCEISGYFCDWDGPMKQFQYHFVKECLFGIEKNIFKENEKVMQLFKVDRANKSLDLSEIPEIDIELALNALDSSRLHLTTKELERELIMLNKIIGDYEQPATEQKQKQRKTQKSEPSKRKNKIEVQRYPAKPMTIGGEPSFKQNIKIEGNKAFLKEIGDTGIICYNRENVRVRFTFSFDDLKGSCEIGVLDFGAFFLSGYDLTLAGIETYCVTTSGKEEGQLTFDEKSTVSVELQKDNKMGEITVDDRRVIFQQSSENGFAIYVKMSGKVDVVIKERQL